MPSGNWLFAPIALEKFFPAYLLRVVGIEDFEPSATLSF
jgi:hypothetical protein